MKFTSQKMVTMMKTMEVDDETYDSLVWLGERSGGIEPPEVVKRLVVFRESAAKLYKSMSD